MIALLDHNLGCCVTVLAWPAGQVLPSPTASVRHPVSRRPCAAELGSPGGAQDTSVKISQKIHCAPSAVLPLFSFPTCSAYGCTNQAALSTTLSPSDKNKHLKRTHRPHKYVRVPSLSLAVQVRMLHGLSYIKCIHIWRVLVVTTSFQWVMQDCCHDFMMK